MKTKLLLLVTWLLLINVAFTQEEKPEINLQLTYNCLNNKIPYLFVKSNYKRNKIFEVVPGLQVRVYITEEAENNLLNTVITNTNGEAKLILPVSAKQAWDSSIKHGFVAVSEETKEFAQTRSEIEIAKARISLDTSITEDGIKTVTVKMEEFTGLDWVPAKDVELTVGVQRLASQLPIGEDPTYTTDSAGMVFANFLIDSLPALNKSGNIVLIAKVENNDSYGNLLVEKTVPWGLVTSPKNNFNKRTLFATRDKAPLWLLVMAFSAMAAVWGVIIYLGYQIYKITKLHYTAKFKNTDQVVTEVKFAE